ncbi:hypothetical protein ACHAXR_012264, partial [Thalassiosira sp. AJA248-18]
FMWNILSGVEASGDARCFSDVYPGVELWKFIPDKLRKYWVNAINGANILHGSKRRDGVRHVDPQKYEECSVQNPPSYFSDRTGEINDFFEDIKQMDLKLLLRRLNALDGKQSVIPDVLCPWGCTEFCFQAGHCDLGLLIQHHLRRVVLNMPKAQSYRDLYEVETSRADYLRRSPSEYDKVLLNENWPITPSVRLLPGAGLVVLVCRHHISRDTRKRLYPHPCRKKDHNLSPEKSDQLCPAQLQPRQFTPIRACKYNTTFQMSTQQASFAGVDSMNVSTEPRFTRQSIMLWASEVLSLAGRQDIVQLAARNVIEGNMMSDLRDNLLSDAERLYSGGELDPYKVGATYVGLVDSVYLQTHAQKSTVMAIVKRKNRVNHEIEEVEVAIQRSWSPLINFLHTEDPESYGTPIKAIGNYEGRGGNATMIQWAVASAISGCTDLHKLVDQKNLPFHHENWAGHMLAHIHDKYMKHDNNTTPKGSPFKPKRSNKFILDVMERCLPDEMLDFNGTVEDDPECFYRFSLDYWRNLFSHNDYRGLSIQSSIGDVLTPGVVNVNNTDVIITVGSTCPNDYASAGSIAIDNVHYEARVVMSITATESVSESSPSKFEATRFVRHGKGYTSWWKQQRSVRAPQIMTKGDMGPGGLPVLPSDSFQYITVYVKLQTPTAEKLKLDFHRSLGGQIHVYCNCSEDPFPLIVTGRHRKEKRECMTIGCTKKEEFICSITGCKTRICRNCFELSSPLARTELTPPSAVIEEEQGVEGSELMEDNNDDVDDNNNEEFQVMEQADDDFDPEFEFEGDNYSSPLEGVDEEYVFHEAEQEESNDEEGGQEENDPDDDGVNGDEDENDGFDEGEGDHNEDHDLSYFQNVHEESLRDEMVGIRHAMARDNDNPPEIEEDFINRFADDEEYFLDDFLTNTVTNPVDIAEDEDEALNGSIPVTNAGDFAHQVYNRPNLKNAPCHVLFNQAGSLLTRHSKRISGTQAQQNFVQRIVSTVQGFSIPLLYLMASCFPRHFYSSATHDPCAILGSAPISCYTNATNPHGFASSLSISRNLATHSSSSTSTCPLFMSFCYDIQANRVAGGIDSRLISRRGFVVDVKSRNGISVRDDDNSKVTLNESVDSHQAALDLAATQPYLDFDWFLTFTCNQAQHPGIKHLHEHKEGMSWTKFIPGYDDLPIFEQQEVKRSFELSYGSTLGRCWKDEYQEKSGNLPHIHGLVALLKEDLDDEEMKRFICSLQKCAVCDLFPTDEIEKYVEEGLFESEEDWSTLTALGAEILTHKCSDRCLRRVGEGDGPENYVCRKIHSVRGKENPLVDEFKPLKFDFTQPCLDILRQSGLWEEPTPDNPNGTFRCDLLVPKRHMGRVHPGATCNMSPVIPQFFAATKSMQNAQILNGTHGVASYVVKYIVKLDEGNRCTVWSDAHTGAVMRAEHQFLHNTKITSSKKNEDKAFEKSRARHHPVGRAIAFIEQQQQILGYPEVMTTLNFVRICTKPFEHRPTTKVELDDKGRLRRPDVQATADDAQSGASVTQKIRQNKHLSRLMSAEQELLYGSNIKCGSYDSVTQFGVCVINDIEQGLPNASIEIFVDLENKTDLPIPVFSSVTPNNPVPFLLHMMLTLGKFDTELDIRMQPTLRDALSKVKLIGNNFDSTEALEGYSQELVRLVVTRVMSVQPVTLRRLETYIIMAKQLFDSVLFHNEIPISDVPPCILTDMLDSKDVELSAFWDEKRRDQLRTIYSNMPGDMDIPNEDQVLAIYSNMPGDMDIPNEDQVLASTKDNPVNWDPIQQFNRYEGQTVESFQEQKKAVEIATRSLQKYATQFGPETTTFNKGNIVHGAPGSGKSHIILYISLYAMSLGLRVMTTALMGVRANALGGVHIHRLFGMMPKKSGNPYRLAELALEKLHRKSQIKYLHALLTMDVLIIDECGQLSAQQLCILDIILRKSRNVDIPFGGVLVIGTMDHTQLGAIEGWPFLLSSHILTDFVMIGLSHSVRAHGDEDFQRIQAITRMSPSVLMSIRNDSEESYEDEFKRLVREKIRFVNSWDDNIIDSYVQRMYARRMPAYEAASLFVEDNQRRFLESGTNHSISVARDVQRVADTRAEFVAATSDTVISALNHYVKEPKKLLFWRGGVYEATMNGEGFNQSQLLLMLEVPSADVISSLAPITMIAAPPGVNSVDLSAGIPTLEHLESEGWKCVSVGQAQEQPVTCRGVIGCRKQYALRHVGSSTINKQMGNTIEGRCAIECSESCSPWDKAQIVVGLSRTRRAEDTIIVGNRDFAVQRMWELITLSNQWTNYIDVLLNRLSVNGAENRIEDQILPYAESFPYRTCDIQLPSDSSGYVYFLVSVRDFDRDYIGQTQNISTRFSQHNSGRGAEGTADPYYRPYCVAAYICGLSHMDKVDREILEHRWKVYNREAIRNGRRSIECRIDQGRRIVEEYNQNCHEEERIRLVKTIRRKVSTIG